MQPLTQNVHAHQATKFTLRIATIMLRLSNSARSRLLVLSRSSTILKTLSIIICLVESDSKKFRDAEKRS